MEMEDESSEKDEDEMSEKVPVVIETETRTKEGIRGIVRPGPQEEGKSSHSRRIRFDPLALLLDASLEGELDLVRKTAVQVALPSK